MYKNIAVAYDESPEACRALTTAIRLAKQMMKQHLKADLDRVIREEVRAIAELLDSPETVQALRAFLERKKS